MKPACGSESSTPELFEPINDSPDDERRPTLRVILPTGGKFPPKPWKEANSAPLLTKALASLGQKYREVFLLRDVEHMSIEETARVLNISVASVKTRLLRARLMLRDILAPDARGWLVQPGAVRERE